MLEPEIVKEPVIVVSVFISKPLSGDIEALTLPLTILFKLSPVTPLAGIFVNWLPSPINEPVNEPVVYEDVNVLNVTSSNLPVPIGCPLRLMEPVIFTEPVNSWVSSNVSPNFVDPDS